MTNRILLTPSITLRLRPLVATSATKAPPSCAFSTQQQQAILPATRLLLPRQQQGLLSPPPASLLPLQQQRRWLGRKAARMGQHMQSLDEQAHRPSREEAKERRKNKKKQKKQQQSETTKASKQPKDDQMELEELVFDDDDDKENGMDGQEDSVLSLPDADALEARMKRVVDRLEESFKTIRGSEATPELFETIPVAAYDETVPLREVAQVVLVSPTLAHLTPYDPSLTSAIRNAVQQALEVNPQVEGDHDGSGGNQGGVVTVKLPRASLESRQKTVQQIGKQAEAARTHLRNLRRKAMDTIKKGKEGKLEGISQDDAFRAAKNVDQITDRTIQLLNTAVQTKQESVLNV